MQNSSTLQTLEQAPRQQPAQDLLAVVLHEIASDAQLRGEAYLQETVVPEGGE